MRRPAALFPIVLALGTMILAPRGGAQAQDSQEGPTGIEKCQTINKSGSYKLVKNLQAGLSADCLVITVNAVTIDLAGFTINGPGGHFGITASPPDNGRLLGIAVRNGSVTNFNFDVGLSLAFGSIVENLRVSGATLDGNIGIDADGIVKGNTAIGIRGTGIAATGTVTGNVASGNLIGMEIGPGSTLVGNTATNNGAIGPQGGVGLSVSCPSNVTDNTAVNNSVSNSI